MEQPQQPEEIAPTHNISQHVSTGQTLGLRTRLYLAPANVEAWRFDRFALREKEREILEKSSGPQRVQRKTS